MAQSGSGVQSNQANGRPGDLRITPTLENRVSADVRFMRLALALAQEAAYADEVPVGAIVVNGEGRVLGRGRNAPVALADPTAHAEVVALREAGVAVGNYRLDGCTLYVTLEPCAMCSGAMLHARLARVVYGAADAKTGAAGSVVDLFAQAALNHRTRVEGGVLAQECSALLSNFFQSRRLALRTERDGDARHWPLPDWALRTPDRLLCLPCAHVRPMHEEAPGHYYRSDLTALEGLRMYALCNSPASEPTPSSPKQPGCARSIRTAADRSGVAWLCLHGARSWSWRFEPWAAALAEAGERVLLPDLPGFGRSDKPKRESFHTIERHRTVLSEWLADLGISRVILVLPADDARAPAILAAGLPVRVEGVAKLEALPDIRRDSEPYPDAGHRAGPRAFEMWEEGCRLKGSDAGITCITGITGSLPGLHGWPVLALASEPSPLAVQQAVEYFRKSEKLGP